LFNFSNRPFLKNKCPLELIELLNYLSDRKPEEIEMVHGIANLIFEQGKH